MRPSIESRWIDQSPQIYLLHIITCELTKRGRKKSRTSNICSLILPHLSHFDQLLAPPTCQVTSRGERAKHATPHHPGAAMGHHHDALRSLCPVKWSDVPQQDLRQFLENHVTEAYTVIDSIPSPTTPASPTAAATAAATPDPAASPDPSIPNTRLIRGQWPAPEAAEQSAQLRREWKEVKVNPRENPLGIQVHKLPGKDGRGAWFARRSIHQGLTFDQWRDGMQCEFMESIKVQEGPGSGAIRGIGADRRVEHHVVPDLGTAQGVSTTFRTPSPPTLSTQQTDTTGGDRT